MQNFWKMPKNMEKQINIVCNSLVAETTTETPRLRSLRFILFFSMHMSIHFLLNSFMGESDFYYFI